LMPFRFARPPLQETKILVTSEVGEYAFLKEQDFYDLIDGVLSPLSEVYADLQAKHFFVEGGIDTALRLISAKYRTKKSALQGGPALHIFVVSLRCDHSCPYCQVSRQSTNKSQFDMS